MVPIWWFIRAFRAQLYNREILVVLNPASTLLGQVKMLMPFQHVENHRQRRDEQFTTQTIGGVPHLHQHLFDLCSIVSLADTRRSLVLWHLVIEEPDAEVR